MQHAVFAFELGSLTRAMRSDGLLDMRAVSQIPAGRGNDPTAPYGDHKRFDFFVRKRVLTAPGLDDVFAGM